MTSIKPIKVPFKNRAICRSLKLGWLNLRVGGWAGQSNSSVYRSPGWVWEREKMDKSMASRERKHTWSLERLGKRQKKSQHRCAHSEGDWSKGCTARRFRTNSDGTALTSTMTSSFGGIDFSTSSFRRRSRYGRSVSLSAWTCITHQPAAR